MTNQCYHLTEIRVFATNHTFSRSSLIRRTFHIRAEAFAHFYSPCWSSCHLL